jgi:hypothetical protein
MPLHRAIADPKLHANGLVGVSLPDQGKHLKFPFGLHVTHSPDDLGRGGSLHYVAICTSLKNCHYIGIVIISGENQNTSLTLTGTHPAGEFDTGHFWHLDIQNSNIRFLLLDQRFSLLTVISLSDDLDIRGMFEKLANTRSYNSVVIRQQYFSLS